MAVELPFPYTSALKSVRALTALDADRFRGVVALAAGAVFFTGVGSLYMHEQMVMPTSSAQVAMSRSMAPAAPVAPAAAAQPVPAPVVPAPSKDEGPVRKLGAGKAVVAKPSTSVATAAPAQASSTSTHGSGTSAGSSTASSSSSYRAGSSSSAGTGSSGANSSGAGSSGPGGYVVHSGDDFGVVAARLGTTPQRIAALNPGLDSTSLSIGQSIRVP